MNMTITQRRRFLNAFKNSSQCPVLVDSLMALNLFCGAEKQEIVGLFCYGFRISEETGKFWKPCKKSWPTLDSVGQGQKVEKNSDPISLKSAQQIFFPGGNKVEKEKGREREVSSCVCMRLCESACVSMCGCESVQVCKCVCDLWLRESETVRAYTKENMFMRSCVSERKVKQLEYEWKNIYVCEHGKERLRLCICVYLCMWECCKYSQKHYRYCELRGKEKVCEIEKFRAEFFTPIPFTYTILLLAGMARNYFFSFIYLDTPDHTIYHVWIN